MLEEIDGTEEMVMNFSKMVFALVLTLALFARSDASASGRERFFQPQGMNRSYQRGGYYGGSSYNYGGGYGYGGLFGDGPSRGELRRQERVGEAAGIINGVPLSPAAKDAVEDRILELIGAHPKKTQPTVSREEINSYLEFLRWKAQQRKKHKEESEEEEKEEE